MNFWMNFFLQRFTIIHKSTPLSLLCVHCWTTHEFQQPKKNQKPKNNNNNNSSVQFTFVSVFMFWFVNGYYELIYISLAVKIDMGLDHL